MVRKDYFNYIFIVFVSLFFIISEKLFAGKDQWSFTGDMFLKPAETIRSIAINPLNSSIIYAGNDTSTIFKSTNGGKSWSILNGIRFEIEGVAKDKKIIGIVVDPDFPDTLFAASDSGGVYRSYDGGAIWTKVGKPAFGLVDTTISSLVLNPINTEILYVGADSGVYKTIDWGNTWFTVNNGLQQDSVDIKCIAIDPVNPNILYGGTSTGKIYKTENAGNNWSLVSQISGSPNITTIVVDPKNPNKLYVGTQNSSVFQSENRGVTFTSISSGFPFPYPRITSLAIDTSSITKIYAGTEYRGVYKKLDTDTSWTAINAGLTIGVTIVQCLEVNPERPIDVYAGTKAEGIFVYTGNRAPVIEDIPDQKITVGNTLVFNVIAVDPDSGETETLIYSVDALIAGQQFDHLYERKFRWTPDLTQVGYDTVIFTVTDQRGGIDRDTVIINVNRNPVLATIGNKTVNEGDTLYFTLSATDPDGDTLNYYVSTVCPSGQTAQLPVGATFTSNGIFRWIPDYDVVSKSQMNVVYYLTFTVSDNMSGSDSETIQIKVVDVNRPPEFVDLPDSLAVNEGQALEFEVKAQDLDLDDIEYHTEGLSTMSRASFDSISTHFFTWIPSYTDSGNYRIIFVLKDARGAIKKDSVNIIVADANRPPVITNISDTTFYVDVSDSLIFHIEAEDPDGDLLSYNVSGKPPGASYDRILTHKFRWIPDHSQFGTYYLKFNVEDGRGGNDFVNITIVVNHPPAFNPISDFSVFENQSLYFTLSAIDLDGDALTYSVADLPIGASVSTEDSIIFNWRPDYYSSGSYSIKLMVADGKNGYDVAVVQITVKNVNQSPAIETITPKAVNVGNTLQFVVKASDPDNEKLTFSASNLPSGAAFDSLTQVFTWTPTSEQIDTYSVRFKVVDQSSGVDSITTIIMVTDQNFPPEFSYIEDKTISENQELIFAVVANDPNLDSLFYNVVGPLPPGAIFYSTASPAPYFKWTPDFTQIGNYIVQFSVSDNRGGSDIVEVNISVINANRNPVIIVLSDTSIYEEQFLAISINVSDPDNDSLTVNGINIPDGAEVFLKDEIYKFEWTPNLRQQGIYSVSFEVVDTYGGADTATTVINVLNYNVAPLKPKIIFPSSGEEMHPTSYFVWEKSYDPNVEDTVSYILEIDNNSDFKSPELIERKITPVVSLNKNSEVDENLLKVIKSQIEESVETVSIRLNELSGYYSITDDILYYWRIRAFDTGGDSSSYTEGLGSFVVNLKNDNPYSVTMGFSPSDSKIAIDLNPEISWYPAVDPDVSDNADNLRYWIQLSIDSTFTTIIFYQDTTEIGINSITVSAALEDEKAWFYRIKTIDNENAASGWSYVQKFFTNSKNNPPSPFGLISPLDKTSFDPIPEEIVFRWEKSVDSDPLSSITYTIEISSDTTFNENLIIYSKNNIPSDSNFISISPSLFQPNVYYWRIISRDNNNLITYSREGWSFAVGMVSGVDDDNLESGLPNKFTLLQNYPNPFNAETIIEYSVPQMSYISIKIFNLLGQEVATLVENVQSPGWYFVKWDGRDMFGRYVASGIYIYSITAKNFYLSKRMLFIK